MKTHKNTGNINNPRLIIKQIDLKHQSNYRIIKTMIQSPFAEYTIQQIAKMINRCPATAIRKIRELKQYELVILTKKSREPTKIKLNTGKLQYE